MTAGDQAAAPAGEEAEIPEYLEDGADNGAEGSAPRAGVLRFARMTGSSICSRDAAPWVTDFLNAAYYRRPIGERDVDDMRLAFSILTTYWYGKQGRKRLHASDLIAFHRAFGAHRFDNSESARGTLSREQLLTGAAALLGDWFADAYADDARRGWGIAFATPEDRAAYDPELRLALARLGAMTPACAPLSEQMWHTYPAVPMPSADGVIAALTAPETWPDFASEIGRFTPLRRGGLGGQIFEIEVAAGTGAGWPMFTRGYVTINRLVTPDDPVGLRAYFDAVDQGMRDYGHDEPSILPYAAKPLVGFDLTTHAGHFMGSGQNRLLLYTHDGAAWVRAAGTWDPMPWHIDQAYRIAGREAQHAFWGEGNVVAQSMLHQLAIQVAKRS
ncbi:MAG TPA: hypothetical protein VHU61_18350 [Solirubrobacteraceae bacterium]|jgi:hypothetical protein|nr:hypothetical protein [Solirubrobacteraceae bacterium]